MWLQKLVFEKKFSLNISQTFLEARLALFDSCSNRLRFGEFPHETYKSVSNNNKNNHKSICNPHSCFKMLQSFILGFSR